MSREVEELRMLQARLCFFRSKIYKFEIYLSEQQLKGTKNTIEYAKKNIKAYEVAADTCLRHIGELIG